MGIIREIPDVITPREVLEDEWKPITKLGKLVKEGQIRSIDEIFAITRRIPEWQIIDWLVPELKGYVIDVEIVQRQTDSGKRNAFRVMVAVGNQDGYIGVGLGKHAEQRMAILKALRRAKKNLAPVLRGCGSWECRCGQPHSLPFKIEGKAGSVRVIFYPGPRGLGLVAGDLAKILLKLAGVHDLWSKTFGNTRTHINFAQAVYNALVNAYYLL